MQYIQYDDSVCVLTITNKLRLMCLVQNSNVKECEIAKKILTKYIDTSIMTSIIIINTLIRQK